MRQRMSRRRSGEKHSAVIPGFIKYIVRNLSLQTDNLVLPACFQRVPSAFPTRSNIGKERGRNAQGVRQERGAFIKPANMGYSLSQGNQVMMPENGLCRYFTIC